ncbi:hypothetical protein GCM10010497_04250 [Streptomyces cinereoruber]|uniref:Uncharacterized protein n=1 Tax=Streptomyces cinereoruber TaxID=67260 RepID=A0AAV4K9P4_9ACTN|nr:hypothetical protein GCM10010497_04250 [Streptomyces cinereoruber]
MPELTPDLHTADTGLHKEARFGRLPTEHGRSQAPDPDARATRPAVRLPSDHRSTSPGPEDTGPGTDRPTPHRPEHPRSPRAGTGGQRTARTRRGATPDTAAGAASGGGHEEKGARATDHRDTEGVAARGRGPGRHGGRGRQAGP